ncbi:hypothetical protein WN55_07259 [Dufourea novaeangliae]|uniref:Uncharacterized protein n=1 Tax=Dufourea novaeangliae TaxID=178035 RepID=A0A154PRR5_DUFNO|nr:hypothetical protein WN55_07259 [Dufourea novaeangliae]
MEARAFHAVSPRDAINQLPTMKLPSFHSTLGYNTSRQQAHRHVVHHSYHS